MASMKEREQFIAQFCRQCPEGVQLKNGVYFRALDAARLILRHAKTHGRLAEESCNGHPCQASATMEARTINKLQDKWDARIAKQEAQIERRITQLCEPFGIKPDFGGDPRDYTVRLMLPNNAYNTWGGAESGYGVPQ